MLQQNSPCGGGGGPQVGPPLNDGTSNDNPSGDAAAAAGLTLSDLGLQAADKLTENIQAPPDVNLGAIGVLSKGLTYLGLGISGYQTVFGSHPGDRAGRARHCYQCLRLKVSGSGAIYLHSIRLG